MREDLLDYLAKRVHCDYLSDLHLPQVYKRLWPLLDRIPDERYPLRQWNQAVSYILGAELQFAEISAAKAFFHHQVAV